MVVSSVYIGRTLVEQGKEWFQSRNQINLNHVSNNTTVVATISGTNADRRSSAPGSNLNNVAFIFLVTRSFIVILQFMQLFQTFFKLIKFGSD